MIKFYTNLIIKCGDLYVGRHNFLPHVYVLTPQRERAIEFLGFDDAMNFLKSLAPRDPDTFQIVPVKN